MTRGVSVFLAGLISIRYKDLKKVIAFRTLSQIRLILFTLRLGLVRVSFYHLISHALFKSTLFITVGHLIFTRGRTQDWREISTIDPKGPMAIVLNISLLGLIGGPWVVGMCSKELIISSLAGDGSLLLLGVLLIAVITTFYYSLRVKSLMTSIRTHYLTLRVKGLYLVLPLAGLALVLLRDSLRSRLIRIRVKHIPVISTVVMSLILIGWGLSTLVRFDLFDRVLPLSTVG